MPSLARTLTELAELPEAQLDAKARGLLMRAFAELHDELADQVTKAEFRELKAVVADLAEGQVQLRAIVAELAEAQARTERRVEELAEAQARTERRVEELAEAQARTEKRVEELAEAMRGLVGEMKEMREELGGLSHSVGYGLENLAYRTLPAFLAQRLGLKVVEPLRRVWLGNGPRPLQVNLWGLAERADGGKVRLLGEAKTQLSASKHFSGVERLVARTRSHWGTADAVVVLVTHMAMPGTEEEAGRRGWVVVHSFDLER
ncbi:MAG: hypothetical protein AB1714_11135 [Acidobacteriota bacterium]